VNEDIIDKSVVELKKMFNQKTKKVFRNLYINKNPILLSKSFFSKKEIEIDIKQSIIEDRHQMIQNSKELKTRIMSAAFDLNSENIFSTDYEYAETAIYGGFFDNNDKKQANSFHIESKWSDKRKIIKSFKDPRLVELAHNLIFINAPEVLTDNEKNKVGSRIANRILDMNANPKSPYMTIPNARTEIDRLRNQFEEEGDQDKLNQLEVIDQYITEMEEELAEFASA
jgi:exonuclease I